MSNQDIIIELKPHLAEWVKTKLNDYDIPAEQNEILRILRPYITVAPEEYVFSPQINTPQKIRVTLPNKFAGLDTRKTLWVSPLNQKEFEKTIKLIFRNRFWDYAEDKLRYTKKIKTVILQFCADHNISFEHINYDTLKKDLYRKKKSKKHCRKMSLNSPLLFLL